VPAVQVSTIALQAGLEYDVARSVTFEVNGADVLTDASAPYAAHYRANDEGEYNRKGQRHTQTTPVQISCLIAFRTLKTVDLA
jgi:hypothetical protein